MYDTHAEYWDEYVILMVIVTIKIEGQECNRIQ